MSPLNQQLDLDGGRHDIAPAHETVKLFDSAPQIRGQIALDTDYWCEEATCPASECVHCQIGGAVEYGREDEARQRFAHRVRVDTNDHLRAAAVLNAAAQRLAGARP